MPSDWGPESSEVTLAGYETPEHVTPPGAAAPRGALEAVTFRSELLDMERTLRVYLPPGYATSEASYPLLVVQDGMDWLEKGLLANTLDRIVGESVEPLVAAFLEPQSAWWLEAGGTGTDRYVDMLATELVPFLKSRYRLRSDPEERAVMGHIGFGFSGLFAALRHPRVFGKAAVQSVQLGLGSDAALFELVRSRSHPDLQLYFDWNRWDVRSVDNGYDFGQMSVELADALTANGYTFTGGEVADSFGWSGWRARTDDILTTLFPLPASEAETETAESAETAEGR